MDIDDGFRFHQRKEGDANGYAEDVEHRIIHAYSFPISAKCPPRHGGLKPGWSANKSCQRNSGHVIPFMDSSQKDVRGASQN
jgi:hypothetical protein